MTQTAKTAKTLVLVGMLAGVLGVAGCSVPALTPQEVAAISTRLDRQISEETSPRKRYYTMAQAMSAAIVHNLDLRLKQAEAVSRMIEAGGVTFDAWPKLTGSAGYTGSTGQAGRFGFDSATNRITTVSTPTGDANVGDASLRLTWNLLDIGIGYFQARAAGFEALKSQERVQQVATNLVHDVRTAYWRASIAQELGPRLHVLIRETNDTLEEAKAFHGGNPEDNLRFQRELLEAQRQLRVIMRELKTAEVELAALINIRPGTPILLEPVAIPNVDDLLIATEQERLESYGLRHRRELRDAVYASKVVAEERRAAILRLFPSITPFTGVNFNSDSFQSRQFWVDGGVRASWDFLQLFRIGHVRNSNNAREDVARARELALAMAIISQIRVARLRHDDAIEHFMIATELRRVDEGLGNIAKARERSKTISPREAFAANVSQFIGTLDFALSYVELSASYSRLLISLGVPMVPQDVSSGLQETELSEKIAAHPLLYGFRRQSGDRLSNLNSPLNVRIVRRIDFKPYGLEPPANQPTSASLNGAVPIGINVIEDGLVR